MAKAKEIDPRLEEFQINIEAEQKARQMLENAGVTKPEDVQTGRADFGRISQLLTNAQVDEEVHPYVAEKVIRDREWSDLAAQQQGASGQPEQAKEEEAPDRLALIQQELDAQKAETAKWKLLLGRSEDRRGKEERQHKDLLARMTPIAPLVDARQFTGKSGDEVMTAQEVSNLMMNLAAAFGNQIREAKEEAIKEARAPEEARIPVEVENELAEQYPWLTDLSQTQKERAIMDILAAQPGTKAPISMRSAVPSQTKFPSAAEMGRARVREVGFIEPSNKGSAAEQKSVTPAQQGLQAKLAELRDALKRPGGSAKAGEILASLGAGLTDDSEAAHYLRRL